MQDILFSFGLVILSGIAFRRLKPGGIDTGVLRQGINSVVLNIFLPALCIRTLYISPLDMEALLIPATAWITTLSALAVAWACYRLSGKFFHLSQKETGVLVISAAFGNVTYLGLPVLTGLYGQAAAKYAIFYDLLATTPVLWLAGASIAARYGEGRRLDIKESILAIVSLPPIWGIVLGAALRASGIALPAFVMRTLDLLGGLVVPLMIFSIGLALALPKVSHALAVIPAVAIKMLVSPSLSFLAARQLGLQGEVLDAMLLEGAMPTMVLSLLIASRFGLDVSLSAFMIVVTTLLSFFSLPAAVRLTEYLR
jgi:predicted permease